MVHKTWARLTDKPQCLMKWRIKGASETLQNSWNLSLSNPANTCLDEDVLQRSLQDIFKTFYQVKLFLLTRFQDIFETYWTRFWDVLRRPLSAERFIQVTLPRVYVQGTKFPIVNSLDILKLLRQFFITPYDVTASPNKYVIVKVGYQ